MPLSFVHFSHAPLAEAVSVRVLCYQVVLFTLPYCALWKEDRSSGMFADALAVSTFPLAPKTKAQSQWALANSRSLGVLLEAEIWVLALTLFIFIISGTLSMEAPIPLLNVSVP